MAKKTSRKSSSTRSVKKKSARTPKRMIYYFGKTRTDGRGVGKELLGGKGANLAEMTGIGLPVPPGFTITTAVCDAYYKAQKKLPKGLMDEVVKHVRTLERELDKRNFRKKALATGLLVETDEVQQDVAHRAARLYRFDERRYKQLAAEGFHFEI